MRISWFAWVYRSPFRIRVCAAGLITILLLVFFWSELCLWAADVNLANRNQNAAETWVARGQWFRTNSSPRACLIQARIARRRGDFPEVERMLQKAIKSGARQSEVQRENWIAMAQANQFAGMQKHWHELLQDLRDDEPEIARSYYAWALLNHQVDLARKTLESWIDDAPKDPEPLILLGRFFQQGPNWEEAEKAYRRAFRLAPNNDEARISLANALQARLKTDEAIPLYREYLLKHPDETSAIQGLSQCLTSKGDVDSAVSLLRATVEKNPNDVAVQKSYGELLLSSGSSNEAATVLEKAYRATPENANLAGLLARALKACGRVTDAEPLLSFVAESRPEVDQMLVLEKQLRAQPDNLELRMKVAKITAKYVSRHDGIRWYQQIVMISPNYLPAHQELVELYRLIGNTQLAEQHARFVRQGAR